MAVEDCTGARDAMRRKADAIAHDLAITVVATAVFGILVVERVVGKQRAAAADADAAASGRKPPARRPDQGLPASPGGCGRQK